MNRRARWLLAQAKELSEQKARLDDYWNRTNFAPPVKLPPVAKSARPANINYTVSIQGNPGERTGHHAKVVEKALQKIH